ncbi:MAG: hypothetical protein ACXWCZ_04050 [Flavisolibacter sp.]
MFLPYSTASITNLEKILSKTHQEELTAYSNIYNLTKGEIVVYYRHNFQKKKIFSLRGELLKGEHKMLLSDLFE